MNLSYTELRQVLDRAEGQKHLSAKLKRAIKQANECLRGINFLLNAVAADDGAYIKVRDLAQAAGLLQGFTRAFLGYYNPSIEVSELYDTDDNFSTALTDLIGPDFEYPDWSHYTIGQVLEKVKP